MAEAQRVLAKPPRVKVLEAAGALADGRVRVVARRDGVVVARVSSSMGDREYTVVVEKVSGRVFRVYSDDNGTKFRGYTGYPIIAVLMLEGALPRSGDVEAALRGVRWRELNEKYKKYVMVEEEVVKTAEARGVGRGVVEGYVRRVLSTLSGLELVYDSSLPGRLSLGA